MTYTVKEQSVQDGEPIFLYQFVRGSTTWRYTSAADQYVDAGGNFLVESISHSEISETSDMSRNTVVLTFPRTNAFAKSYIVAPPTEVTSVTIWRGHEPYGEHIVGEGRHVAPHDVVSEDGDEVLLEESVPVGDAANDNFVVYWRGRVASGKAFGAYISLECESILTSMRRQGIRRPFQLSCPHALYGRGCNIDKAGFAIAATVTGGTELSIETDITGYEDGYFTGGMIELNGVFRFIVSHVGGTVGLMSALPGVAISSAVSLYPGCDKTLTTCNAKFSNLLNFGGQPWMSGKNPFNGKTLW